MYRTLLSLIALVTICVSASADRNNFFPGRSFVDIRRPETAQEVRVSYRRLVSRQDGIDQLEAKLIALYEMVEHRMELGYQLRNPKVIDRDQTHWEVHIPSEFSINNPHKAPDFVVCIDKIHGTTTCFGPAGAPAGSL
jgi:hypothetical protein